MDMFQGMEYVYEVYKEKSFTRAAQNLFISQPSLSASIRRIEEKIGYPIFDRSTKPLSLTACGEKYIESAEHIMAAQNEFSAFVNDWGELKTGSLTLGGSSLSSSWVPPQLMGAFTRRFPQIAISLTEESTAELERFLLGGKVDLIIDNCVLDTSIFDSCVYGQEHLLLAVPSQFASNKQAKAFALPPELIESGRFAEDSVPPVSLRLFEQDPFIILKPENDTGKRALEICHAEHISPKVLLQLDQQQTAYNITCSGLGISFISDTLILRGKTSPHVTYYKLAGNTSRRTLYFYWKKGRYFTRAMEEFLKIAGLHPASS